MTVERLFTEMSAKEMTEWMALWGIRNDEFIAAKHNSPMPMPPPARGHR